jgi:hypothetical protein
MGFKTDGNVLHVDPDGWIHWGASLKCSSLGVHCGSISRALLERVLGLTT